MNRPVTKRAWFRQSFVLLTAGLLQGCQLESMGLELPEGDPAAGKRVFVERRCNDCHTVADIEYAESTVPVMYMGKRTTGKINVVLGGKNSSHRTQGELVTAVINPSHEISTSYARHLTTTKSPMQSHNESMTVQNLIDLVAFLQQEFN